MHDRGIYWLGLLPVMLSRRGRKRFHRAQTCVLRPLCTFSGSMFKPTCFCSVDVNRGHRGFDCRLSKVPSLLTLGLLHGDRKKKVGS